MKTRFFLVVLLVMVTTPASADDGEKLALAQVRLSTDAGLAAGCLRVGQAADDSIKDLRRKIVKAGGNTGIVSFGIDEIYAQVFRCAVPVAAPPAPSALPNIPPPPPGFPPPPPPDLSR